MGEFRKLNYKIYGRNTDKSSPDVQYWKTLGVPTFLKEFGPVDYIDFSPVVPYYFAVTSSVRVQVYNPVTRLVHKNLSRFEKSAFGGCFRSDGKLLCAGGEENYVKLFDVNSKTLLRVFKGHEGPVHRCFFTVDNVHIVSFSDDQTVSVWDIPSEQKIVSFNEHNDYIRAGAVSPVSSDIIVSGGYDGCIKMYDKRSESVVFSLNHGSPVESVIFLPTGGIFLSAGGTEIKAWDVLCGGRLLARLHHHHKTVTSLRVASHGRRIISGSLDRHVNVYDVTTFQKVHSMDYPNSVLSIGISPKDDTIAVGMVDGLVSVSKRKTDVNADASAKKQKNFAKTVNVDTYVANKKSSKMPKFEQCLKRFEHTKALQAVLIPDYVNKTPEITVSVLQELMYRKNLHPAVAGFEDKVIVPLLKFLCKYIGDYRFTRVLIEVANIFLDVYEDSIVECGPQAVDLFLKLSNRLEEEIELTESLLTLEGSVNLVMSVASAPHTREEPRESCVLKPSESARDFVVNVN